MTVKTIFKVLLMTIVVTVVSAIIIEFININVVGLQINQLSRIATRQACEFFGQETYKREVNSMSNLDDILGTNGGVAVSGTIYGTKTPPEIYNDLYKNSTYFKVWAAKYAGVWKNLDYMLMGMSIPTALPLTSENLYLAKSYYDNNMTPLNLGIPYLDKDIVQKITQWNLAKIFSNGQTEMVVNSDGPRVYVKYKGFRVYVNEAEITDISYQVINVVNERDVFMALTNIDSASLGITDALDERANVCVAGITYRVPVAYEGVTPFRRVMQYVWNTRAAGYKGTTSVTPTGEPPISEASLEAGGFTGNNTLAVPGDLVFYIIK